jgi:hypothetical protein
MLIVAIADLLIIAQKLAGLNKPPTRDYLSVKYYFDMEDPVCNVESYVFRREDLISLKPGREIAWLDGAIEKLLQSLSPRFTRVSRIEIRVRHLSTN